MLLLFRNNMLAKLSYIHIYISMYICTYKGGPIMTKPHHPIAPLSQDKLIIGYYILVDDYCRCGIFFIACRRGHDRGFSKINRLDISKRSSLVYTRN